MLFYCEHNLLNSHKFIDFGIFAYNSAIVIFNGNDLNSLPKNLIKTK